MKTIKMTLAAIYILLLTWVLNDITLAFDGALDGYLPIAIKIIGSVVSGTIFVWGIVAD